MEAGYGLCLKHLAHALTLDVTPPVRGRLVEIEAAKLACLEWELEEALRKSGWEYRPEAPGAEATAWRRALLKFSGLLDRRSLSVRIGLVAFGLLLGLAATLAPPGAVGGRPLRLILVLPDGRVASVLALLAMAGLLVLAQTLPRPRRRRRGDEEDDLIVWEPPRPSPWLLAALLGLVLLPLGVAAAFLWQSPAPLGGSLATTSGRW